MKASHFLVVPGVSVLEQGKQVREDVLWVLEHQWGLRQPGAVFSISGGMSDGDNELHPLLSQVLTFGINAAVHQTGGWVISAGLDTGVNRLVATGLRAAGETAPCIGIAAWSACNSETRAKLVRNLRDGGVARMTARPPNQMIEQQPFELAREASLLSRSNSNSSDGAQMPTYNLEPHHSHFVLVDDSTKAGSESADDVFATASMLRTELENKFHTGWEVPQLLLCLGSFRSGRLKTLRFITSKLKANVPVLFVRETKGVAGLVSRFMETLRQPHRLALKDSYTNIVGEKIPKRAQVHPTLIPWENFYPTYRPAYFVSETVLQNEQLGADPEILAK